MDARLLPEPPAAANEAPSVKQQRGFFFHRTVLAPPGPGDSDDEAVQPSRPLGAAALRWGRLGMGRRATSDTGVDTGTGDSAAGQATSQRAHLRAHLQQVKPRSRAHF
jgi:hypothetical protein